MKYLLRKYVNTAAAPRYEKHCGAWEKEISRMDDILTCGQDDIREPGLADFKAPPAGGAQNSARLRLAINLVSL